MQQYNWLAIPKGDLVEYSLVNEKFDEYSYPQNRYLDEFLEQKFLEHGITCRRSDEADYYELIPVEKEYVRITAPLYTLEDGSYVKIAEYFEMETLNPETYIKLHEEAKQCRIEVREEQAKVFDELYLKNSLDGGLSSCITIGKDGFSKYYIPEGYLIVAKKDRPKTKQQVVFMKKRDFMGRITIKVPNEMRQLVVGTGGKNIKKVAKKLHVYYIHVE